ncbi:DUF368 domain-containing protein [Aristaeella lactis]|uniref:Membrane protein n=1 Tax=Aristaeella lactis TaxID=3046383 RepID=A0AC61PJU8_9FIRM|nr:DUF368 domain-containing protein [Aristaeella lactis]QUA51738.1 DUF368 domain-containing protein [Aristaeella lactis]SMC50322.1 putative membrane protein [Aristaeella lactis]
MLQWFLDILRGAVIGVSNIIPGVSGGTMAVSMGIYDRVIYAVNNLFKQFKKNFRDLLPIIIGVLIGLFAFAALIGNLLGTKSSEIPMTRLPTNFAFIGLILGGLPAIYKRVNMKSARIPGVILFLIFLALVVVLPLLNPPEARTVDHSIGTILLMIPLGAIASSTMVVPGISGSMILMLLGYYNPVINAMNDLRGGDWSSLAILAPYAIGLLVGIVFIAKLMNFLLKKHAALTFSAIFGLVIGSPVALLMQNRECFQIATTGNWIISIVCLVIGFAVAWFMSTLDKKQSEPA